MKKVAAAAGWRYFVTCDRLRKPAKGGQPFEREESFLRLACEPGDPSLPHLKTTSSPSSMTKSRNKRARKRQREVIDLEMHTRARVLAPQPDLSPPTAEQILKSIFWSFRMFDGIPRTCLFRVRKSYLNKIQAFNSATPPADGVNFLSIKGEEKDDQWLSLLRVYMFSHAILRRLYPGKEGAVDASAEITALRARL